MKREQGYIALISVLIVGAVALAIGITLLVNGIDIQRATASTEDAAETRKLADACAEEGLAKVSESTSFAGTGNLTLGDGNCSYTVTSTGSSTRTITASGVVNETTRKVQVYVTITTSISITSWQEVI